MSDEHEPAPHGKTTSPAITKPVEVWAEEKGFIRPGWDPDNRYVSRDARHSHFAPQHFNVAFSIHGWARGREVTEADFNAAISAAQNIKLS